MSYLQYINTLLISDVVCQKKEKPKIKTIKEPLQSKVTLRDKEDPSSDAIKKSRKV